MGSCYLLPAPCSLLPKNQKFVPHGYKTCSSFLLPLKLPKKNFLKTLDN
ncbi:hypothetical protein [Moorena producens]|nr:hypothetical protein [Moorena producens]